jgi:regulator of PEP synthase PpsR (kinase-PPPase family)
MRNEYDFTKSKKARDIKQQAEQTGIGYQTLINQTLRESLQSNIIKHETISAEILRKVLREELALLTKEDPL